MDQYFYTFREYMNRLDRRLSASMEDYLEMIYRLSLEKGYTRMSEVSNALNVQPPAATRMVQKLAMLKLIKYQKYGILELEESGMLVGASLLSRHKIVERFLKVLGVKDNALLEETEKTEHTLSKETLDCITLFLEFIENNPQISAEYESFKNKYLP